MKHKVLIENFWIGGNTNVVSCHNATEELYIMGLKMPEYCLMMGTLDMV